MNDLISYLMQRLQRGGTSVAPYSPNSVTAPSTSLVPHSPNIIDGEWSEVPRGLNGPGGSFAGLANPLMAAVMGSVQGDVLNNHRPRMYGSPAPANPVGQVTSAPMPPITPPSPPISGPQSGPPPLPLPSPPISGPQTPSPAPAGGPSPYMYGGGSPPPPAPTPPYMYGMGAPPTPMPQPRPQMAPAPTPMPQARPPQAPQAQPEMSFFQRNAAMMRDPATGAFIDPQAAARVQAQGGGLMDKMMGYLHNKANNA